MGIIYLETDWYKFRVVPYKIYGANLYAVQRDDGMIERYCNSKIEADNLAEKCNQGKIA
jgi:hypothetical protein